MRKNSLYNKIQLGDKFGRLTVIEKLPPRKFIHKRGKSKGKYKMESIAYCKCDCGMYCIVRIAHLLSGFVTSCGCYQKETVGNMARTHGKRHTRLYHIWLDMRQRCSNPNRSNYSYYGGRGIVVCDEWNSDDTTKSFLNFYHWSIDNGYHDGLSIDRIDNDGPYAPWNCRWVDDLTQGSNKSNNRYIWDGHELLTCAQFERKYNVSHAFIANKIEASWDNDAIVYAASHQELHIHKVKYSKNEYRDKDGFLVLIPKLHTPE